MIRRKRAGKLQGFMGNVVFFVGNCGVESRFSPSYHYISGSNGMTASTPPQKARIPGPNPIAHQSDLLYLKKKRKKMKTNKLYI